MSLLIAIVSPAYKTVVAWLLFPINPSSSMSTDPASSSTAGNELFPEDIIDHLDSFRACFDELCIHKDATLKTTIDLFRQNEAEACLKALVSSLPLPHFFPDLLPL